MVKLVTLIFLFCHFMLALSGQSKQELQEQNDKLKIMFNKLSVEILKIERQQKQLEIEKSKLTVKASILDEEFKKKTEDLNVSKIQVTKSDAIIEEKLDVIKTKDEDLVALNRAKSKVELEVENRKSTQKILILSLSIAGLISILLLIILVSRRKANKVLKDEKHKSDALLLNILPKEIADELKSTSKTLARSYGKATVLFADIKNFTQISSKLTPDVLIHELDYIFGTFDDIIQKYNIEKIKIIGDCYMCVGGIPQINDTNPEDVANAAIEMQQFMHKMKIEREASKQQVYEVRIGINTGPIVAGVIGSKKFAYDVWGDTVNVASRIEAAGEPGKVNISKYTYDCIKSNFPCIHRGKIEIKGKNAIDMYFVTGPSQKKNDIQNMPQAV